MKRSSTAPMPSRCFVFSCGRNCMAWATSCLLSSFGSPKIEPMPMASKGREAMNLALSSLNSLKRPPWTMPYNACDLSLFSLLNAFKLRCAQAWVRSSEREVVV